MIILSRWEVEELLPQLESRGHLWQNAATHVHPIRWVRRTGSGHSRFALTLTNGLPNNCYSLQLTVLDDETLMNVQEEVLALLRKLTSFGAREAVERYLATSLASWGQGPIGWGESANEVKSLAFEVCKMTCGEQVPSLPTEEPTPIPAPAPKRSRFLENLLKGRK